MKRIVICLIFVLTLAVITNAQAKTLTGTVVAVEQGMYKWEAIVIKVGNKRYFVYTFSTDLPTPKIVGKIDEVGRTVQISYSRINKTSGYDGEVIATKIVEVKKSKSKKK